MTSQQRQRGSALLMAIVMTMLLFIIGIAFMISGATERTNLQTAQTANELDNAAQAIIKRINTVLVDDLFGRTADGLPDPCMLNNTGADEPYDYPGAEDRWLASTMPQFYRDYAGYEWYLWPHITDLWNRFTDMPAFPVERYFDPDNTVAPAISNKDAQCRTDNANNFAGYGIDSTPFLVSAYWTAAKVVGDRDPIEDPILNLFNQSAWRKRPILYGNDQDLPSLTRESGARADADGDGIADARWVRLDEDTIDPLITANGQPIYAAVRIIDNCSMINLNTALRDPRSATTATGNWDGTQLGHIDLAALANAGDPTDFSERDIRAIRCNDVTIADYEDAGPITGFDLQYERDVALRLKNPAAPAAGSGAYAPFSIEDELELRNRWCLPSRTPARVGFRDSYPGRYNPRGWANTFDKYFDWDKTGGNYGGFALRRGYDNEPWSTPFSPREWQDRILPNDVHDDLDWWYMQAVGDDNAAWAYDQTDPKAVPPYLGNIRLIATVYSYDRLIAPRDHYESEADFPTYLKSTWKTYLTGADNIVPPIDINSIDPTTDLPLINAAVWLALPAKATLEKTTLGQELITDLDGVNKDNIRQLIAGMYTANLIDYLDTDSDPTVLHLGGANDPCFYGFEPGMQRACISKLGVLVNKPGTGPITVDYAIELYNPSTTTAVDFTNNWTVEVFDPGAGLTTEFALPAKTIGAGGTMVLVDTDDPCGFNATLDGVEPLDGAGPDTFKFTDGYSIQLVSENAAGAKVLMDSVVIPSSVPTTATAIVHGRDLYVYDRGGSGKVIGGTSYPVPAWVDDPAAGWPAPEDAALGIISTGDMNAFSPGTVTAPIQIDALDGNLLTIGEMHSVPAIGSVVFQDSGGTTRYLSAAQCWGALLDASDDIPAWNLSAGRLDPCNVAPNLTRYFTTFNIASDGVDNDGDGLPDEPDELAIAGRINLNTAPWTVLAQLPWMQWAEAPPVSDPCSVYQYPYRRAIALQDFRDSVNGAFTSTADVLKCNWMTTLAQDVADNTTLDYDTAADATTDDIEERNLLFERISNVATVRSDTFTAYILVRIGRAGPQKRFIAILDRTNVTAPGDAPRLVAFREVPDPY